MTRAAARRPPQDSLMSPSRASNSGNDRSSTMRRLSPAKTSSCKVRTQQRLCVAPRLFIPRCLLPFFPGPFMPLRGRPTTYDVFSQGLHAPSCCCESTGCHESTWCQESAAAAVSTRGAERRPPPLGRQWPLSRPLAPGLAAVGINTSVLRRGIGAIIQRAWPGRGTRRRNNKADP